MSCEKKLSLSSKVKRCISLVVILQCFMLLLYLYFMFTQSPKVNTQKAKVVGDRKQTSSLKQDNLYRGSYRRRVKSHRKTHLSYQNLTKQVLSPGTWLNTSRLANDARPQSATYLHRDNVPGKSSVNLHENAYIIPGNVSKKLDRSSELYTVLQHSPYKQHSNKNPPDDKEIKKPFVRYSKNSRWDTVASNVTSNLLHKKSISPEKNTFFSTSTNNKFIVQNSDNFRNLFKNYNPKAPGARVLLTDTKKYLHKISDNISCFTRGTVIQNSTGNCLCKSDWFGLNCSVPQSVYTSYSYKYYGRSTLRLQPKRIINAIIFNMEWELLEARMYELGEVVDMFVILESNYTMYGDPKKLMLLQRLREGYLQQFHYKIVYVLLDHFPAKGKEDGWITDRYLRNYMGSQWMKQLTNIKKDDVFVYTDTDELPSAETMLFLKLHDGYGEPFGFTLRWSVYGFFWRQIDPTRIMVGSSVNFLLEVLQGNVYDLRTVDYTDKYSKHLDRYLRNGGRAPHEWYIGDGPYYAGWHCSWCLPPEMVVIKLKSAINADFPRWGDYPEKLEIPYIQNLIKTGTWFDDRTSIGDLVSLENDRYFAPKYLIQNYNRYKYLLNIKYAAL